MSDDSRDEFKKRFDGTHHKGTLTGLGLGAAPQHQRINLYLETTDEGKITNLECQMTPDQVQYLIATLTRSLEDLSLNLN